MRVIIGDLVFVAINHTKKTDEIATEACRRRYVESFITTRLGGITPWGM